MFEFPKRVLAFHAHPDDTESFCSGTLALLKEKGYEIIVATMTAGGMGGINSTECQTIVTRKKEAAAAAKVLGAEYCCFDQRDGFVSFGLPQRPPDDSGCRRNRRYAFDVAEFNHEIGSVGNHSAALSHNSSVADKPGRRTALPDSDLLRRHHVGHRQKNGNVV